MYRSIMIIYILGLVKVRREIARYHAECIFCSMYIYSPLKINPSTYTQKLNTQTLILCTVAAKPSHSSESWTLCNLSISCYQPYIVHSSRPVHQCESFTFRRSDEPYRLVYQIYFQTIYFNSTNLLFPGNLKHILKLKSS